jgi:dolichol-phosphate mannosyltransferase
MKKNSTFTPAQPAYKTLSILIPAYNESSTIVALLEKVKRCKIPLKKEIIVVDDGSTDTTAKLAKKIPGVTVIVHAKNSGKGSAIRTAISHATGDIIIIQDADLEYDPTDYAQLIAPIIDGQTTVVYGSRRLGKDNKQYSGLFYFLGGWGLTFMTNMLYPGSWITDEPTCYKVFRSDVLKSIRLDCTKFEFCPEVTAKVLKRGIRIIEVPIRYYPRSVDEGKKIKLKDGFDAIWTLLKYRFTN